MDSPFKREQALEFLEGIEHKHNELLDSLDELNDRIEFVLERSLTSHNSSDQPNVDASSAGDAVS